MSSSWIEKLAALKTLTPVWNFFGGRHTTFAIFFSVCGTLLAWRGLLTAQYVSLIVALQAFVLGHSIKESVCKEDNTGEDEK